MPDHHARQCKDCRKCGPFVRSFCPIEHANRTKRDEERTGNNLESVLSPAPSPPTRMAPPRMPRVLKLTAGGRSAPAKTGSKHPAFPLHLGAKFSHVTTRPSTRESGALARWQKIGPKGSSWLREERAAEELTAKYCGDRNNPRETREQIRRRVVMQTEDIDPDEAVRRRYRPPATGLGEAFYGGPGPCTTNVLSIRAITVLPRYSPRLRPAPPHDVNRAKAREG